MPPDRCFRFTTEGRGSKALPGTWFTLAIVIGDMHDGTLRTWPAL
ncbi:hypothetical protein [Nannocystis radixulma]|uniref:Transposase n=1 Tax=Nannocystis radixulma TaxID=2995305 RepID=A0ABT5AY46_9BACT|nr:hypothetical protein [Nannocystis radixulma]MDC0666765.1 hypothetical protein [Nannocystis radixulma]